MTCIINAWSRRAFVALDGYPAGRGGDHHMQDTRADISHDRRNLCRRGVRKQIQTSMSASDVDAEVSAVRRTPGTIYNGSGIQAALRMRVIYPNHPVGSISLHANRDYGYWLAPADMEADLERYAPARRYDSVIVIWRTDTHAGQVVPGTGWVGLPPTVRSRTAPSTPS